MNITQYKTDNVLLLNWYQCKSKQRKVLLAYFLYEFVLLGEDIRMETNTFVNIILWR